MRISIHDFEYMDKFHFSRTYDFRSTWGRRRHLFFQLEERKGRSAVFLMQPRKGEEPVEFTAQIASEGNTETATFAYEGHSVTLRADLWHPKGYGVGAAGYRRERADRVRDLHMHTSANRSEIEESEKCYCLSCQREFPASEVTAYCDEGATAVCPHCGVDAVAGDAGVGKVKPQLLLDANMWYFDYRTNPRIKLDLARITGSEPAPCTPYVWMILLVDKAQEREGISEKVGYFSEEEAREKFRDWMAGQEEKYIDQAYQAVGCQMREVGETEAIDAISVALARYFLDGDDRMTRFKVRRAIDFEITMPWPRQRTIYFTLNPDKTIDVSR